MGKVLQDTISDGSTPYTSTYWYDGAGRLTQATIPDNTLTYAFAGSGSCGANTAAGNDGNRTGYTDTTTGGTGASSTPVSVSYCYDWADRLTSDRVSNPPSGASPLLAGNLASTGTSPNLTYDSHGDITTLADQTMTYDETGRHVSTTTSASPGTTVTYTRDASDAAVGLETKITGGTDTTVHYSNAGGVQFTLNGTNTAVQEQTLSLPGGVTESIQSSSQVWSYPDLHGDDTVTADASGTRSTGVNLYDPFGDPIDLTTGLIGTLAANTDTPDNTSVPGTSYGWEGSHLKQNQTSGDIATIEMGARQYVPLLGRFLSVDSVAGGNSNGYNYPNDPIDGQDLTGNDGDFEIPDMGEPGNYDSADYDTVHNVDSAAAAADAKELSKLQSEWFADEAKEIEKGLDSGVTAVEDAIEGKADWPTAGHANELPQEGELTYEPPKKGRGQPFRIKGTTSFLDKKGYTWAWAEQQHGGAHWDVTSPFGGYRNVFLNGSIHGGKGIF